jgi:hypothetical protein
VFEGAAYFCFKRIWQYQDIKHVNNYLVTFIDKEGVHCSSPF